MKTTAEPPDSPALVSLTQLLRAATAPPTAAALERGLNELRARYLAGRPGRRDIRRWGLVLVAASCLLAGGALWLFRSQPSPAERPVAVSSVEGGRLLDGGYLAESEGRGVKVQFNEGTEFVLAPGTRGRIRALGVDGAKFAIERGSATFRIVPSPDHQWSVEAGPFVVTVKGTDFTVDWDPSTERLHVSLRRGRVAISGPILSEQLVLRPGQKLSVNLPQAETLITEEQPGPTASAAATNASSSAPLPAPSLPPVSTPSGESQARSTAAASSERGWVKALANGQWDQILADVERDGVAPTLQAVSSAELFALADAARYRRRSDLARAALLAHRRRFPSSPRSTDATFLLGRTEEVAGSTKPQAIRWYDEYLVRAPTGRYAAEALGRKMSLLGELGQSDAARRAADDYLDRFPEGSYAGAARALVRSP